MVGDKNDEIFVIIFFSQIFKSLLVYVTSMEKDITELKNCPSIERVHEILVANVETPSFPYITALLEFTIPQLFDSIRDSKILIQTFQTLIAREIF